LTTLLLIRHGENQYTAKGRLAGRLPGVNLNANGRAQAQALGAALKGSIKLKAVYSSPLDRTMETAQYIADAQGLAVQPREGLIETALGDWEGQTIKSLQRKKAWRLLQERPSRMRFPDGESIPEQQARLVAEVEALLALHKPKDVIAAVGHADPIRLLVAHYIGLPLDLFQRIIASTASVSVLHFAGDAVQLVALNQRYPVKKD
jgi:probable phosphoglycerate mutase